MCEFLLIFAFYYIIKLTLTDVVVLLQPHFTQDDRANYNHDFSFPKAVYVSVICFQSHAASCVPSDPLTELLVKTKCINKQNH